MTHLYDPKDSSKTKKVAIMDQVLFRDKGQKSATELATFLRAVAERVEAGSMTLNRGEESLALEMPKQFGFRFNVKDDIGRSGTVCKVQIGFRWKRGSEDQEQSSMTIS
ncbi:amphi-Trp domain-containing protein [Magnetococcales bacterium HHB-1]